MRKPAAVPETDSSRLAVVPDLNTLAKAEKKVHDEMDAAFAAAVSPSKKQELARKLIENGQSADDPVRRYVMWCAARDLAAEGGQPATMIEAVDHLAGQFRIDPLDMKADAMANFPPKSTTVGRSTACATRVPPITSYSTPVCSGWSRRPSPTPAPM